MKTSATRKLRREKAFVNGAPIGGSPGAMAARA